jgi:hypothetical protein
VLGSSAVENAPPHPQTIRSGDFLLWQDENKNKQRQGITMVVVSCLLLFLTVYGILGLAQ